MKGEMGELPVAVCKVRVLAADEWELLAFPNLGQTNTLKTISEIRRPIKPIPPITTNGLRSQYTGILEKPIIRVYTS